MMPQGLVPKVATVHYSSPAQSTEGSAVHTETHHQQRRFVQGHHFPGGLEIPSCTQSKHGLVCVHLEDSLYKQVHKLEEKKNPL